MNRIEFGDCRETMRRWAAEGVKVQTCVTSPPYFGLRDYGHDGQLGLEETPEQYVAAMVEVFRCVRDILADDGTVWLNIGDSYNAGRDGGHAGGGKQATLARHSGINRSGANAPSLKPKDLIGIPWMLAFALRADGWYLRQDIIWHKPNPMPESVTDRCTKAHEYIFLLSKSPRYFFDSEAFKEPAATGSWDKMPPIGGIKHPGNNGNPTYSGNTPSSNGTRNRRSVWSVTTRPYSGAHFATYPPELITPCILAGTSEQGCCSVCGAPRIRELQVEAPDGRIASVVKGGKAYDSEGRPLMGDNMIDAGVRGSFSSSGGATLKRTTTGWRPSCECEAETVPCIVLDPFMGSGTTAAVAVRLGRRYLGCELNPAYAELQRKRIAEVSLPLFDET